jgi:transposase
LVDTEGLVLKAKVHSAKVPDQDGLKLLLESARSRVSGLKHLWLDAGYEGRGKRWAEEGMGLSVAVVRRPAKPVPEEVARSWAQEWAKEGEMVDWQKLMPPRGFVVLLRRWVVERTFSWLSQNRRMSKDYERLCATAEAFKIRVGGVVLGHHNVPSPSGTFGRVHTLAHDPALRRSVSSPRQKQARGGHFLKPDDDVEPLDR